MSSAIVPSTRLDRILLQLRAGLTGLLFAISKESTSEGPPRIGLILLAIFYDFYQVIQFPLNPYLGWNNVANLRVKQPRHMSPILFELSRWLRVTFMIGGDRRNIFLTNEATHYET